MSYWTMPVSDGVVEILKRDKTEQAKNMYMYWNCYNLDYAYYVCVNKLGELFKPDYITVLLNLGYQMKDIQKCLGHADFSTTTKHMHMLIFQEKMTCQIG